MRFILLIAILVVPPAGGAMQDALGSRMGSRGGWRFLLASTRVRAMAPVRPISPRTSVRVNLSRTCGSQAPLVTESSRVAKKTAKRQPGLVLSVPDPCARSNRSREGRFGDFVAERDYRLHIELDCKDFPPPSHPFF